MDEDPCRAHPRRVCKEQVDSCRGAGDLHRKYASGQWVRDPVPLAACHDMYRCIQICVRHVYCYIYTCMLYAQMYVTCIMMQWLCMCGYVQTLDACNCIYIYMHIIHTYT